MEYYAMAVFAAYLIWHYWDLIIIYFEKKLEKRPEKESRSKFYVEGGECVVESGFSIKDPLSEINEINVTIKASSLEDFEAKLIKAKEKIRNEHKNK